jgi:hypothetical protein
MPTDPAISPTADYWNWQLIAAAVLVVLFTVFGTTVLRRTNKSVLTGPDNRWSTSRFTALLWTGVVVYMLAALVLIGLREEASSQELGETFEAMDGVYLALLGGPYAAFLLAKVTVQTKTSGDQPSLQKVEPPASAPGQTPPKPGPSNLVQDDAGNTDIADFQYVLFNLMAAGYVLALFIPHPGLGIPAVPSTLAILAGGSALTYVTNKAVASNAPNVTAMLPTTLTQALVTAGKAELTLVGHYLRSPGGPESTVLIGGLEAPKTVSGMTRVVATVPTELAAKVDSYLVEVVTAAGLKASPPEKLSVVP